MIPVKLSVKILDVMILPQGLNKRSRSASVIDLDRPQMYKFAPLIDSQLGRAKETFKFQLKKRKIWLQIDFICPID